MSIQRSTRAAQPILRTQLPVFSALCSLLGLGTLLAGCSASPESSPADGENARSASASLAVSGDATPTASPPLALKSFQLEQGNLRAAVDYVKANPQLSKGRVPPALLTQIEAGLAAGDLSNVASMPGATVTVGNQVIQLQSDYLRLSELGSSLRARSDSGNLDRYYRLAHGLSSSAIRLKHPSPGALMTRDLVARQFELDSLIKDLCTMDTLPPGFWSLMPPTAATCAAEAGYELGTDGSNSTCAAYATNGIMGNVAFPLRDDLTCVRSQGRRGTCTAFGATAAIETGVHVMNGNKVNLSEQHAYWHGETVVDYANRYSYGVNAADFLQDLASSVYKVPKEKVWNYNPSLSIGAQSGNTYPSSCVGYAGEECTDFAFQGEEVFDGANYSYPNPMPNAGAFGVATAAEIGTDALALDFAKILLDAEIPLVTAIDVTASFVSPNADGYVTYVANETVTGGHAVHIAGWVDNANLPVGAPAGAGGGYYVVKNSWGVLPGDCGYFYLPYQSLLDYGRSLTTVDVF